MGIIYFEENALEVPKRHIEGLQEWEKVAVSGFRPWLEFWGLEACKDNSGAASLIDFGMNMPRPTEEVAFSHLEGQARASMKVLQTTQLENVYKEVLALERYFLANYEKHEFRVRYWEFIALHVTSRDTLTEMHRYKWIADRMDFYNGKDLNKRLVVECLDRADSRIALAEARNEILDLSVGIDYLLTVRKVTKAA